MHINSYSIELLWELTLKNLIGCKEIVSRNGKCKEVLGSKLVLYDVGKNFLINPIRKLSPWYAAAELLWYLSGTNEIEMIKYYASQYKQFSDDGITTWGSYGYRWHTAEYLGQIQKIIDHLKENPESRRAVMTCYDADIDLNHRSKDIPCTISLQFLIRYDKLHCICTMRSNDVWLGMPYDIWCFTCLQILIAQELGIDPGMYIHQPGSLHLYERNYEKAKQVFKRDIEDCYPPIAFDWDICGLPLYIQVKEFVGLEKENREGGNSTKRITNTILGQCALWTGIKDRKEWIPLVINPEMRKYMERIW